MGAPSAAVPQARVSTETVQATAPQGTDWWLYEMPLEVTESMHWRGSDADRVFCLAEPTSGDMRRLANNGLKYEDAAFEFVRAIGVLDEQTGKVRRNEDGSAVWTPVGHQQIAAWKGRLSAKAQSMVVAEFVRTCLPSEAEGEALRRSRRRAT